MIKTNYPYIDRDGVEHPNIIRTWTNDKTKMLLQVETGNTYDEALDLYPCRYTYQEIDRPVEEEETTEEENEVVEEAEEGE